MLQGLRDRLGRGNPAREFFEGGRAYTSFRRALWRATDLIAMAIYHLHVKVIGRKSGSSAVASAAYRSGSRLRDERLDRGHDFSAKRGVVHSEVLLPENAPAVWKDRERLWNDVEAFEVRKDAQLAREVEFAIPREMTERDGIELARDFVRGEFVDRGMIADLNVHWDVAEDGMPKPHAHVMLTMRTVDENGFGQRCGTGTALKWWSAGANAGRSSPMSAWPNSTLTHASTIAAWRHRASRWNRKARSARPRIALRIGASRARRSRPTARRCTARLHAAMARESSRIPIWGWTRSRISNRPSRAATWRSSRTATATGSISSTRLWTRCGARPIWSNSARTGGVKTASPPAD